MQDDDFDQQHAHDYRERQRSRDVDYKREYEAWLTMLSAEERRQLADMGLDAPSVPGSSHLRACLPPCATFVAQRSSFLGASQDGGEA